jgi:hypothetical protein
MDKTQPVRITSDTGRPFAACTNLPVRQEMLSREMMKGVTGGNPYAAAAEKIFYSILAYEAINKVWKPASEYITNTAQSVINPSLRVRKSEFL